MRLNAAIVAVLAMPGVGGCLICNCLVAKASNPVDFTALAPAIIASLTGSWGGDSGSSVCSLAGWGRLDLDATGPTDCMAWDLDHPESFPDPTCTAAEDATFPLVGSLYVDDYHDAADHRWRLYGQDEEMGAPPGYGTVTLDTPAGLTSLHLIFGTAGDASLRVHVPGSGAGASQSCEFMLSRLPDDDQPGPAL